METQSKRGHPHRPLVSLRVMELKASADKAPQTPAEFIPGGTAKPRAMICTRDISTTWSFSPSNFALLCTSALQRPGVRSQPPPSIHPLHTFPPPTAMPEENSNSLLSLLSDNEQVFPPIHHGWDFNPPNQDYFHRSHHNAMPTFPCPWVWCFGMSTRKRQVKLKATG